MWESAAVRIAPPRIGVVAAFVVAVVGVVCGVGASRRIVPVMLAIPASASFDHHFTAVENKTRIFNSPRAKFRAKAILVDRPTRNRRVGRVWYVCRFVLGGERCRYHFHFNGRVGGFGNLKANGKLTPHHRRLNVVGGTHDFNKVAGRIRVSRWTKKIHFDLTR